MNIKNKQYEQKNYKNEQEYEWEMMMDVYDINCQQVNWENYNDNDGIENKIHPGDPMDKNLYDLPPEELTNVPTVCGSLREALDALDSDRDFLKKGDVFTDDSINAYLSLKWDEVHAFEHTPHPIEFSMYYSV